MGKIQIEIRDQRHLIDASKITLLCPSATFHEKINYSGKVVIDASASLNHVMTLDKDSNLHPEATFHCKKVFPNISERRLENPGRIGTGAKHVLGRVSLSLHCQDQGLDFVWRYPEAYLHPSAQLLLADLIIELYRRGRSKAQVVEEGLEKLTRELGSENLKQD